jgi:hemin uptake protein HemP
MNQASQTARTSEYGTDRPAPSTSVIDSTTLMSGGRELIIRHGAESYRLRVTASNKLILTK